MMLGVIHSPQVSSEPPNIPDGAEYHMDFIGNKFYEGTTEVSASTLMADYDAGDRTADGLDMTEESTPGGWPKATGNLYAYIEDKLANGGFTMFVEVINYSQESLSNEYKPDGPILEIISEGSPNTNAIYADMYSGYNMHVGYNAAFDEVVANGDYSVTAGIQRMAATFFADEGGGVWRTSATMNGAPVDEVTTAYAGDWQPDITEIDLFSVEFWDYLMHYCRIRSITFFDAKTTSEIETDTEVNDWPVYVQVEGNIEFSDTTTHTIDMVSFPSHQAGDFLLVVYAVDGSPTVSINSGTGWTIGGQTTQGGVTFAWLWKFAAGGDTLSLATSAAERGSYAVYAFRNVADFEVSSFATGSGADAQTPSLSPTPGTGKYACLSILGMESGTGTEYNDRPPDAQQHYNWIGSSNGASVMSALQYRETSNFTPDAWDTDAEDWIGMTLVLIPNTP